MLPNPTELILIISSFILIKSPPKNEVIPENLIILSVIPIWVDNPVVTEVATIGDWIKLSRQIKHFPFWLNVVNVWEAPIPTLVILKVFGIDFSASSADADSLTFCSFTFTI